MGVRKIPLAGEAAARKVLLSAVAVKVPGLPEETEKALVVPPAVRHQGKELGAETPLVGSYFDPYQNYTILTETPACELKLGFNILG